MIPVYEINLIDNVMLLMIAEVLISGMKISVFKKIGEIILKYENEISCESSYMLSVF